MNSFKALPWVDSSSLLALLVCAKTICITCITAHRYNNIGLVNFVGGVSGALGRITGALAKTTTKLTLDKEFQEQRKRAGAKGIGQGLEGAAKVDFYQNITPPNRSYVHFLQYIHA